MEPAVDQGLTAAFARDGVACVRSVLDPAEVAVAAAAIDAVLARPGPLAQVPKVRFYHDHVLVKEGGTTQRTPWHQDQPYYNVDGQGVSAWIPVDPVPEDGCLELWAGSHRGPWLMPRTFLRREARWFPEGSLAELPAIDADPGAFDIRRFSLAPGDAIFFDFLTVHGAPGFPYPGRRRVLSLRYLSDDARHAPRTWRTSPPFVGLEDDLPAGAPMHHPMFPVAWPAEPGRPSEPEPP
jgi:ectoine hydroxylase-related dioxygenase (phytanoyl-CoA dioxygenase family)